MKTSCEESFFLSVCIIRGVFMPFFSHDAVSFFCVFCVSSDCCD